MPRSLSHNRKPSIRFAGALIAASLSFATGCLEEDKVTPALREASARLEALGAPGTAVPGDEFRMSEYRAAIGILRPIASDGSDVQNASAALMIARAEMGLAEIPAAELADVNQRLYDLAADARGELDVWKKLNSLADTAASFNPEEELAKINTKIQQRDAEILADAAVGRQAVGEELARLLLTSEPHMADAHDGLQTGDGSMLVGEGQDRECALRQVQRVVEASPLPVDVGPAQLEGRHEHGVLGRVGQARRAADQGDRPIEQGLAVVQLAEPKQRVDGLAQDIDGLLARDGGEGFFLEELAVVVEGRRKRGRVVVQIAHFLQTAPGRGVDDPPRRLPSGGVAILIVEIVSHQPFPRRGSGPVT